VVEPQDRLQHSLAVDEESLLVGRPTDKVILSQLWQQADQLLSGGSQRFSEVAERTAGRLTPEHGAVGAGFLACCAADDHR
jgi:hypothetical protein